MARRFVRFACESADLIGTLDEAGSNIGLLIVSGGNELRAGPWGSQSTIASRIAEAGFPVFRFDRRGIGDSAGDNAGFASSLPDIAAAIAAFRAEVPQLGRIVGYGNCDAASALMLAGGSGLDSLVLANPWTFDPEPDDAEAPPSMPPAALRAHYLRRLANPRALLRLLTGKVALGKLATGLAASARGDGPQSQLAAQMAAGIAGFEGRIAILLAERDRTAQAFRSNWDKGDSRLRTCPDASHSFVEPQARIWLQGQILGALRAEG